MFREQAHFLPPPPVKCALFLSLGGGSVAWAALAANSVSSKQIKNGQVKSADVRDDTLNGGGLEAVDLDSNSVGADEVANDSLMGFDIDESTLEGVNAETVDGFTVTELALRKNAGDGLAQANLGPFAFVVGCAADGDITVQATNFSGPNDSLVATSTVTASGATYVANDSLDTGFANALSIPEADDGAVTQFVFAGANPIGNGGMIASGSFTTQEYPVGGGLGHTGTRCVLEGTAIFDP